MNEKCMKKEWSNMKLRCLRENEDQSWSTELLEAGNSIPLVLFHLPPIPCTCCMVMTFFITNKTPLKPWEVARQMGAGGFGGYTTVQLQMVEIYKLLS